MAPLARAAPRSEYPPRAKFSSPAAARMKVSTGALFSTASRHESATDIRSTTPTSCSSSRASPRAPSSTSTGRPRDRDHDLARSPATAEPGRAAAGRLRSTTCLWLPRQARPQAAGAERARPRICAACKPQLGGRGSGRRYGRAAATRAPVFDSQKQAHTDIKLVKLY